MNKNKVLNTNPVKFMLAGFFVIALFFGGLAVWSIYFPFEGAVIANGIVQILGEKKVVQHLEGGIIDKIYVIEGDSVEKGDILIKLQNSGIVSNVDLFQGRLLTKLAESARLAAEITMKEKIKWPAELLVYRDSTLTQSDVSEIMSQEEDIFFSGKFDLEGKLSLNLSQIKQLESRIDGVKEQLAAEQKIIANLTEELEAKRPLFKDKYMDKSKILTLERELLMHKGNKGKLRQDIAEHLQKIEELKLNNVNLQNQYREKAITILSQVRDTIFELREQIKPLLDARKRLEIKAPISGVIINMEVNSEKSGVIQSGMPLLEIVPRNSALIISARINPRDITSVKKGQKAKVALSAFERRNTPPVPALVKYISSDLVTDKSAGDGISYYEVHVDVNISDLQKNNVYLSPGMPVVCYITTEKRNIISYLVEPLLKNIDQAMRE